MPDAFVFVAGGAVQAGGGLYLERGADRELLQRCVAGDFTYVLTSRQMGKSSLMYRAAERLAAAGAVPVVIDLTELGAQTTVDQWYKGFLFVVQERLGLRASASEWWDAHASHAFAHRFTRYLRDVALVERPERLVLFVDEIDTTLRLDFTDDFFAAIRFLYQQRAVDPELHRISFVLIGVATPNDLIKDAARTPFNVGHRVELTDFTPQEASTLARHLSIPPDAAHDVIAWVLRWTGGHPYLTMRALRSLMEAPPDAWTASAIDARVHDLFFGPAGESDTNLQFVRDMLTKKAFNREAVLGTYETIRGGGRVPDRELDQVASWLKLSGIVRSRDGLLRVRNPVYERVFDQRWARTHRQLHVNWRRRLARAAAALLVVTVLVTIPLAIFALRQRAAADDARLQAEAQREEAVRQRAAAELQRDEAQRQLLTTQSNLQTAQEAVDALKQFDPKAAAALSAELSQARSTADTELKRLADERETLRRERDQAVASREKTDQENAALGAQTGQLRALLQKTDQENAALGTQTGQLRALLQKTDQENAALRDQRDQLLAQLMTPQPAPAPAAATQGPDPLDDVSQVMRVLERYRSGYEALNARAVAGVYPAVDVNRLQQAFNGFSKLTYEVKVSGIAMGADGQTATVTASETLRPVARIGNAQPQIGTAVFAMRKVQGTWEIASVKSSN